MLLRIFKKINVITLLLILLIAFFLSFFLYFKWGPLGQLKEAFEQNQRIILDLKHKQADKEDLLEKITSYRDGLYALNLILEARKNISVGSDEENPYLVFDFLKVLSDLRDFMPKDARVSKFQMNNKGLVTLPVESVDYASLGRVMKSFKDRSYNLPQNSENKPRAFKEVKIPSGVQRTLLPDVQGKLNTLKSRYSFILQAQLNPEFWRNSSSYLDVDSDAYYSQAIEELKLSGDMKGYDDGEFKPMEPLHRREFFETILFRLLSENLISQKEYETYSNSFHQENWSKQYLELFERIGLPNHGKTELEKDQLVSRKEALLTLLILFGVNASSESLDKDFNVLPFIDISPEDKNLPLFFAAQQRGLFEHMGEKFEANIPVTRVEMAYWLWRLKAE